MDTRAFTRAYIHAAAFTTDTRSPQGEYPMPELTDFASDFLAYAAQDCERFLDLLQGTERAAVESDLEHAGRDFWYTRNGHGCGFWDGDWPKAIGKRLTELSKKFGEYHGEVFADGREFADQE